MHRSVLFHGDLREPARPPDLAIAAKGFRPFFLLAAAFAAGVVPLWLTVVGGVARPIAYLDPASWHAHEMVFGFAAAVIAGFLLTAVGNWTQRETLVGAPLLALAALWVAGRGAMLFAASLPRGVPAAVDLAFLPLLGAALARPLVASNSRRNFVMLAVLGALFALDVVAHMEGLGLVAQGWARRACLAAVDVVALVMLIIAGRVFPMFTRNATGVASIRSIPRLDAAAVAGMAAVVALDVFATLRAAGIAAGAVGVLAAARAVHWGARRSLRQPLLWILHAGYAWLTFGLLLRAASSIDAAIPASLATHALTVGAIGSLTLGMMARVSLGHTGRPLVASRAMTWAFAAVTGAAVARVLVPLFAPGAYMGALVAAGVLWTCAFATFLAVYAPILTARRADGKAG